LVTRSNENVLYIYTCIYKNQINLIHGLNRIIHFHVLLKESKANPDICFCCSRQKYYLQ